MVLSIKHKKEEACVHYQRFALPLHVDNNTKIYCSKRVMSLWRRSAMTRRIVLSWSSLISYVEGNSEKVPESAGVYELLVMQKDNKYLRRYIGRADDSLRQRFLDHLSDEEENECIKERLQKYTCGFDYALVSSADDRADAEQALYDKYSGQAICNQIRPSGSGRGNNIELIEQ